ncbi:DUF6349 family protein [Streptomyces acidiscabies]|uniref:DUF6349 family protein n=1 Tax=Streptomyces acidiscabies TaxID=42234 RepID=UPI0030CB5F60
MTESIGARARQTYYWRVRNGRTRVPTQSASRTWHIQAGHPGGAYCDLGHELDPPAHHTPTLLTRSRPLQRRDQQEFRGGCLACDWEGAVRDGGNEAVEDAHDHAFPGWQTLPPITSVKDRWEIPQSQQRWAQLASQYPEGWVDQGAPLLVWNRHRREEHAPPHAGRPRYELRVERPPDIVSDGPANQGTLF